MEVNDSARGESVLAHADRAARAAGAIEIATHHLLLGALEEDDGRIAETLAEFGIAKAEAVLAVTNFSFSSGGQAAASQADTSERLRMSKRAEDAWRLTLQEDVVAASAAAAVVLGLLREREGSAAGLLEALGLRNAAAFSERLRARTAPE